jgi:hypothetical protein
MEYNIQTLYETAESFYFGKKHPHNPAGIVDLASAAQFYKKAFDHLNNFLLKHNINLKGSTNNLTFSDKI